MRPPHRVLVPLLVALLVGPGPAAADGEAGALEAPRPALELARADENGDGKVALAEWLGFFATADRDKDGKLDAAEWETALAKTAPRPPIPPGPPAVGAQAPQVQASTLDGKQVIDLGTPKRTTVLVFGSWT